MKVVMQIDGFADPSPGLDAWAPLASDEIWVKEMVDVRPAMGDAAVRVLVAEGADPEDVRRVLQKILVDADVFLDWREERQRLHREAAA